MNGNNGRIWRKPVNHDYKRERPGEHGRKFMQGPVRTTRPSMHDRAPVSKGEDGWSETCKEKPGDVHRTLGENTARTREHAGN